MKIALSVVFLGTLVVGLFIAFYSLSVSVKIAPSQVSAEAQKTYIGNYVNRVDDTERGVTCYTTGPSGIDCLSNR